MTFPRSALRLWVKVTLLVATCLLLTFSILILLAYTVGVHDAFDTGDKRPLAPSYFSDMGGYLSWCYKIDADNGGLVPECGLRLGGRAYVTAIGSLSCAREVLASDFHEIFGADLPRERFWWAGNSLYYGSSSLSVLARRFSGFVQIVCFFFLLTLVALLFSFPLFFAPALCILVLFCKDRR